MTGERMCRNAACLEPVSRKGQQCPRHDIGTDAIQYVQEGDYLIPRSHYERKMARRRRRAGKD